MWDTLTPEAKTEFQKAGYQPPKPKPEEPDLISLLQIHAKNLPEAVREALPPPAPIPEPDPVQDGLEKGNALRKAVMKLRDLGQRKLKLQGEIDASKTHLRELLKRCKACRVTLQKPQKPSRSVVRSTSLFWRVLMTSLTMLT